MDKLVELTKAEKTSRYDALMAAIRFTRETYQARRTECLRNYEAYGADTSIIGAYNKGMADAFDYFIDQLRRFDG